MYRHHVGLPLGKGGNCGQPDDVYMAFLIPENPVPRLRICEYGKTQRHVAITTDEGELNAVELLEGWDKFWTNFGPNESTCFFLFSDSGHQNGTRFVKYNLEWHSAVEVSRTKKNWLLTEVQYTLTEGCHQGKNKTSLFGGSDNQSYHTGSWKSTFSEEPRESRTS